MAQVFTHTNIRVNEYFRKAYSAFKEPVIGFEHLGGDTGASTDSAAGAGRGQALLGADDDELANELREYGKHVKDEPPPEVVVSRFS
ncbi:hypothetical protein [Embleya sp. NPDC059237]|uniref:hypothetical protein n=1 Tax=Embleya sp. NPDC059237 TaxID=3346784 RepID=UPI0036A35776